MKKISIIIIAIFGSLVLSDAQTYQANLDGLQEVPPNASPAFGQGDPDQACALLGLVQTAKDHPTLDMTHACRRCLRAVRVQSAK